MRRCASSWTTTVSSASGGARISRHENESRPLGDALPQRDRWSRMRDRRRCRRRAPGHAGRSRHRWRSAPDGEARRRAPEPSTDGRPVRCRTTRSSSSGPATRSTEERRTPSPAISSRSRWRRPRYRNARPVAQAAVGADRPRASGAVGRGGVAATARGRAGTRPTRASGSRPVAAVRGRDGHHHAAVGVDDHPEGPGTRRAPEGVRQRAAGELRRRRPTRSPASRVAAQQASRALPGLDPVQDRGLPVDDDVVDAGRDGAPAS